MRSVLFALACLTSVCHARKLQVQHEKVVDDERSSRSHEIAQLQTLLLTSNPVAGFQLAGAGQAIPKLVTKTDRLSGGVPTDRSRQPSMMADKKMDGYYARPSAAVEQGGGFYAPGLEDGKYRYVAAGILIVGLLLNRFLSPNIQPASQLPSEALGLIGLVIILYQQYLRVQVEEEESLMRFRSARALQQGSRYNIDKTMSESMKERALWASNALLGCTTARAAMLLSPDGSILVRQGLFPEDSGAADMKPLLDLLSDIPTGKVIEVGFEGEEPIWPLPRYTETALMCRVDDSGMLLLLASEQPSGFEEKHGKFMKETAKLIALQTLQSA